MCCALASDWTKVTQRCASSWHSEVRASSTSKMFLMRSLGSSQNKDIELANKAGSGLQPSMCTGHGSDPREWAGEADETESGIERARSSGARARGGGCREPPW